MGINNRVVYRWLSRLMKPSIRNAAMEEFQARYEEIVKNKNQLAAIIWLWQQILFLLVQRVIESLGGLASVLTESFMMTLRRFKKERTFMLINGFGLAAGLFCVLIILAYVRHEAKYDRFHEHSDRIYRISLDAFFGGENILAPQISGPVAPLLKEQSPDVEAFVRFFKYGGAAISTETSQFGNDQVLYADPAFFDVFSYEIIHQSTPNLLDVPNTVVLTKAAAIRYFGTTEVVGKTLYLQEGHQVTVAAVMADVPKASHVHFDVLCSMSTLQDRSIGTLERWLPFDFYGYILARPNANLEGIEQVMAQITETHLGAILKSVGGTLKLHLQPLTSIHLYSQFSGELETNGNAQTLFILSGIGLFVLIVAGLNAVNLMTARRLVLTKEMTIRQTLGAGKMRLIAQMLLETFWTTLSATLLAWVLIVALSGSISDYLGFQLTIESSDVVWLVAVTLGTVILFTLCSGLYPAISLLRGGRLVVNRFGQSSGGRSGSRYTLVLLQFVISIVLIIASGTIQGQLQFFNQKNLGFNNTHRIVMAIDNTQMGSQLKTAFAAIPGVLEVGKTTALPGDDFFKQPILPEGRAENERVNMNDIMVDPDYFPMMEIPMVAGRNFDWTIGSDEKRSLIINESAATLLGWQDPIGKTILLDPRNDDRRVIVGVVRDFNYESLHHAVAPLMVTCRFAFGGHMVVELQNENMPATLAAIKKAWLEVTHGQPFGYRYLDQAFDLRYQEEQRLIKLIRLFTGLALMIAALGLWGMAVHTTERRTKEIGIRRTLGASVTSIGWKLSNQMLKWILLANIAAWPLAYWVTQWWLGQFAYRQSPSIWVFVSAALFVLLIGVLSIGWRTWRAARANPVHALRYE
ncbi:ABC transporter permease [bacterium]|nr:ABC transporter permease [bacterium]